ncbi:hypothetical protein D3C87_2186600 [compost metagenome]
MESGARHCRIGVRMDHHAIDKPLPVIGHKPYLDLETREDKIRIAIFPIQHEVGGVALC